MAIKRYTQNESAPGVPNEVTHLDFTTDEYGGVEKAEEMKVIKEQVRATEYARYTTVDDLVSTDTEKPLSANQGKVLKDNIDTVELQTNELTQIVATKDQQNLNQHNSMQKRLAVTEAETYNGSDLENYEPTNEVGIASDGTDISASVEDGSVELVTEGKSFENLVKNGDASDGTTGWVGNATTLTAVDGEFVCTFTAGSSASGMYQGIGAVIGHVYAILCDFYPKYGRAVTLGVGGALSTFASTNAETWQRLCKIVTATTTGSAVFYHNTEADYGAGDTHKFKNTLVIDLTALGLDTILDTTAKCDAYFNYVNGLASSLPHDVESVGVNLCFDSLFKKDYYWKATGELAPLADSWYSKEFFKIPPSVQLATSCNGVKSTEWSEMVFYDSNFNYIIGYHQYNNNIFTSPVNAQYCRFSLMFDTGDGTNIQLELGTSATTYQPHKSNHTHCPVTLNQVPTVKDTFNFKTGVHGVNTAEYILTADDIYALTTDWVIDAVRVYKTPLVGSGDWTTDIEGQLKIKGFPLEIQGVGLSTTTTEYAFATGSSLIYLLIPKGLYADLAEAKADLAGTKIIYELADASKYTVQYPPQNLIAYKGGQISRIPMLRDNGISTGGTVSLGTIPISRMGDVYEYIGAESSLVDPDDITLAGDGLSFAVAGGGDNEVYDYVGYYDTAHSTYPVQQVQYTTDNVASKLNDALPVIETNTNDINDNKVRTSDLLQRQMQIQYGFPAIHPSRIPQLADFDASKIMYFRCSAGRFNFSWNNSAGRLWTFPEGTVLHSDGVTPIRTSTDEQPDVDVPAGVVTLHSDAWDGSYKLRDYNTDIRFIGDIADLPLLTYHINLGGCSQFTGDLSDCPVIDDVLSFSYDSLITGAYTQVSGNNVPTSTYLDNTNISSSDMDATLIAYAACTKDNGEFHATGMERTTASDTAVTNLTGRGWTISGLTVV